MYKITENSPCHLWTSSGITASDLKKSLKIVKTYTDESHLIRHLEKCLDCGQLFFYEFYETVDWIDGNDPQYRTWIPVDDEETAEQLSQLPPLEIQQFRRIIIDWPKDLPEPSAPRKII